MGLGVCCLARVCYEPCNAPGRPPAPTGGNLSTLVVLCCGKVPQTCTLSTPGRRVGHRARVQRKTSEIDQLFDTKCCKIWTPKDGCCVAGNGGMAGVCGRPVHWTGPSEALGGHHTTPVGVGPVSCVCTVWTQKMQQLSTPCSEIVCAQGGRHRRAKGLEMLNNF